MLQNDLYDDTEDTHFTPQQRVAAASRSTWVSVAVNVLLTAVQITVGVMSKSQALVADGIHSLSDLVADFVVLFAGHHARKDADEDHPYGHQRFETAASLVLGVRARLSAGSPRSGCRHPAGPVCFGLRQTTAVHRITRAAALRGSSCEPRPRWSRPGSPASVPR